MENRDKKRVVFAFVEAGLGHIMPMKAVCDAFEKKYGERVEIIKTYFFQDKNNPDMKYVEDELIKEVKLHNKNRRRGKFQFALLDIFGSRLSLKYLMTKRYKKGYRASMDYMRELDADLVFNTHFTTLYYACEAKKRGEIHSDIVSYCPDPIIGRQWDTRTDLITLSSSVGKRKAERKLFGYKNVGLVPFLINEKVKEFDKGRAYYRREIGVPEDNFTVLLADGAYGAGKLRDTVLKLLESEKKMTVIAACGKNEKLYQEFLQLKAPENICFKPFGFTDKMLTLSACCDLFVGKAGASNLAEPAYFGAPQIVSFCATPIEKWICRHYTHHVGSALKVTNINKIVKIVEKWCEHPEAMAAYSSACSSEHRADGPEKLADILYSRVNNFDTQSDMDIPSFLRLQCAEN